MESDGYRENCGGVVSNRIKSTKSMKPISRHICNPCHVTFNNESGICPLCEQSTGPDQCPDCGKRHRATYHGAEPCDECCDRLIADSKSQTHTDGLAAKIHAVRLMAGHNAFTIEGAGWLAEICELALASESQREAAESADEKPGGQAENAGVLAHADEKTL